ncbi:MAG: hypothetical protein EOP49_12055 [Sphingobacteriales bacterium]|nr:MAG: hypothetical protein EOP49_12055 [Sphingobacteriales bacterium]
MTEQTTRLDLGDDTIADLDADAQGSFIAITTSNIVHADDRCLPIAIDLRFPLIRKLDEDRFIVVDQRTKDVPNGHIYSFTGEKLRLFLIGDGVEDILVHNSRIVATYFDEGVVGSDGPNNEGLAVFDFEGQLEFGFNTSAAPEMIVDCYCACRHETNRVLFYAYSELKLYELNLDNMKVKAFETPRDFAGAGAVSGKGNTIILHSSYEDKESFFEWNRVSDEVRIIGSYPHRVRGIGDGKFLAFDDTGFTFIDPTE